MAHIWGIILFWRGFTMGSDKSIYHPQKTLTMPLCNTPLELAITSGFPSISIAYNNINNNRFSTASAEMHVAPNQNFGGASVLSVPPVPLLRAQTTWGEGRRQKLRVKGASILAGEAPSIATAAPPPASRGALTGFKWPHTG